MKSKFPVIVVLLVMFLTLGAASFKTPGNDEKFQNLKVLPRDISEEKLDSTMDHFAVSLGVRCGFCHAASADTTKRHLDFASDKKEEKDIAREMFKMTAYINANFFNSDNSDRPDTIHAVVCYTCHRGTKEPDARAFLSLIDSTLMERRKKK